MNRCIAYRAVPGCPHTWFRCRGKALRGFDFCRRHTDVIHGILLGLTVLDGLEQEQAAARTGFDEPQPPPRKTVVN